MEDEREKIKRVKNLLDLPEGCLSHILSLTSPFYVLRSSLVCKLFRSIANSDLVWENFLPSDLHFIQRSSAASIVSTRHLVLHLCRSFVCLEGGNKSFSLDKWTGKKCYMLGARELKIESGDDPYCWRWRPLAGSRFPEVAELLSVTQLRITGRINTQMLSPNTTYHAYFSFKLRLSSQSFDVYPVKVAVSTVDPNGAYLRGSTYDVSKTFYLKAPESDRMFDALEEDEALMHQTDAAHRWLKIDMGKYFNRGDSDATVLEMTLMGTELVCHKSGLIVHGIELVPLD